MSVLDFLWNGSPPPNVSTTTVSTPTLPDWYQSYLQGLLAKSNSIAGADFQTYGGPRVAGFTDDQKNAFQATRDNYGTGVQLADQGATIVRNAAGASSANALKPYIDKAGAMSALGSAQPYITTAAGMSGLGSAQPMINKATSIDQLAQAYPYLQASSNANSLSAADPLIGRGLSQSGASAALPYVAQGAGAFPDSVDRYMNPYNQQVTDRIGALAARNLKENILPGINTQFIASGQFGGSRQGDITARAIRDANESALGQQAQVLQQGYAQAGQQFTADQARAIQAGQTLGGLTQGDAAAALQAANLRGNLTATDAARQLAIGQTTGQLAGQNADRALSAATLSGSLTNQDALRQLQAAQLEGNLTSADRSAIMDAGKSFADATNMDATRAINAGSTLGGLGQIRQNLGLRDAAALEGIGSQEQQLNQQNLSTAYNDFLEQRGYPAAQTQYLSSIFRGLAPPASTTATNVGPGSTYQASPLAQLAGGLGTATALKSALGLRRGGRVPPRRGGLAAMRGAA